MPLYFTTAQTITCLTVQRKYFVNSGLYCYQYITHGEDSLNGTSFLKLMLRFNVLEILE